MQPISEMLGRLGIRGRALASTRDIAKLDERNLVGAIVSAASTSGVKDSLSDVCAALREAYPPLPVAITTLMSAAQATHSLKGLLTPVFGNFVFLSAVNRMSPQPDAPATRVLLITREDLTQSQSVEGSLLAFFKPARVIGQLW